MNNSDLVDVVIILAKQYLLAFISFTVLVVI